MRSLITAIAVAAAISFLPSPSQAGILGLFGFDCCGGHNCGCGRGGCGGCCEAGCGCDQCCEPACGCGGCCEPACGCGTGCFANGRQYAGQCFSGCCETRVPICPCVGRNGGCCQSGCGCGECCEPACGCNSCCEPACGCGGCCEPACGCGSSCGGGWGTANCPHKCCLKNFGFCSCCGHVVKAVSSLSACNGCNGEVYWSEWHNDPPYCQDSCNSCGEWTGRNDGACGCNGGCSTGACGCNGGYNGAQAAPMQNNSQYAQRRPANRTVAASGNRSQQQTAPTAQMRSSYASQQQGQSNPLRTASRPGTNRVTPTNGSNQSRPILW